MWGLRRLRCLLALHVRGPVSGFTQEAPKFMNQPSHGDFDFDAVGSGEAWKCLEGQSSEYSSQCLLLSPAAWVQIQTLPFTTYVTLQII